MTDADFIAWLKTDKAYRCVLVEAVARVGGVETTRYMSNRGYVTTGSDTPANRVYEPYIVGGGVITETLALDGNSSGMVFGDIELDNSEGNLDSWLADVWVGRVARMYVGDVRWARADFRLVFDGIIADIDSRDRDVLNIKLRDKLQRLNTNVTETTLGGSSTNANSLLPIVLGEVHNITPLLTNKATLEYQYHNGVAERVIEVRDNGVVISPTVTLSTGKMTLAANPAGQITASVQGGKLSGAYVNTVAKLVELLATTYGTDPFSGGDLDASNLSTFDAANTQPVGVYLTNRENVLALCQGLASSVGAQVVMSATGLLRLLKVDLAGTSPTAVTASAMLATSLQLVQRVPVVAGVKLNFCRNWTVQNTLRTGIPAEHADLYAKEWLSSSASDATTATVYKLTKEPEPTDTYLLTKTAADAETARRLALWKTPRSVYKYTAMPELLLENLGGYQTITHSRFNMSGGVSAQIVKVARDWLNMSVEFEVLV